jgi:hypothetical protein
LRSPATSIRNTALRSTARGTRRRGDGVAVRHHATASIATPVPTVD